MPCVYIDGNELTGSIPTSIDNLSNLQDLFLKKNFLTGTIPTELQDLTSLQHVLLEQNDFNGTTSGIFCNQSPQEMVVMDSMKGLETLVLDCKEVKLACPCCTMCCKSADVLCNNKIDWETLHSNASPNWQDGYFELP